MSTSWPRPLWTISINFLRFPQVGTPGFEAISPLWPLSPGKAIKLPFPTSLKTRVSEIQFGTGVQRSRDFGIRINHMYSISPSSWTSLPTPHPSSSSHSPELSFLCYTAGFHQLSILHMVVWVSVCVCVCVCVCESLRCVWLFAIPWTVACQASLSMEFSRQEYWSG